MSTLWLIIAILGIAIFLVLVYMLIRARRRTSSWGEAFGDFGESLGDAFGGDGGGDSGGGSD